MFALQVGPQFGILMDKNKNLLQNGNDALRMVISQWLADMQLKLLKFRIYGRYAIGSE